MVCKTWSQPDAKHFRWLCTNSFYPDVGSDAKTCVVCVTPSDTRSSGCQCTAPDLPRAIYYLRVSYIGSSPTGTACVVNAPIGDFVLLGQCGAKTSEDQITVNLLQPVGVPTCTGYDPSVPEESRVKRYSMGVVGTVFTAPDSRKLMSISLTYNQRGAVWSGPSPIYNQNFSYVWDGVIPWCQSSRGAATLLQRGTTENPTFPGLFPPSVRAIISTEPFE